MYKYHKNKRVKIERFFILNGIHYSVAKLDGKEVAIPTSELSDNKSEFIQNGKEMTSTVTKINPDGAEVSSKIHITKDKGTQIATEWTPAPEDVNYKATEFSSEELVEKINLDGGATLSDKPVTTTTNVIATNNSGKRVDLGSIDELEKSPQVKKLKFDVEAIQRCLDGKQKRHKNYSFSTEEVSG